MNEFREWSMLILEAGIFYYVAREFYYDRDKDLEKAHKKTRTTKKTTSTKEGGSIIEESTEVSEPVQEEKK